MKKLFVIVPYMDRPSEAIQADREAAVALWTERTGEEVELVVPKGKRLTGDLEAMFAADVIVAVKYAQYDHVCQLVQQAAFLYGKEVYEDRHIPQAAVGEE